MDDAARSILLARHAATGNAKHHIISGTHDEPLSDEGRAQLEQFVAAHGRIDAAAVISSPLSRARDTAAGLSGREVNAVEVWDDCIDRSYGKLQGLPPADVDAYRDRIDYVRAGGIDHSVNPPGGETLDDLRARAEHVAARLLDREERRILLVSHQAFLQQLTGVLMGWSLVEALAVDIKILEVSAVDWASPGQAPTRRVVFPGVPSLTSW